jgi:hypothetical protein
MECSRGVSICSATAPTAGKAVWDKKHPRRIRYPCSVAPKLYASVNPPYRIPPLDAGAVIRQAIADYAEDKLDGLRGFRVGGPASPFEMAVAIGTVEPAIFVISVAIGPYAASLAELKAENMPMEVWQKAAIAQAAIEVDVT